MIFDRESIMDHEDGVEDCKKGVVHRHLNDEYTAGYAHQYELEQKQGGRNENK